MKKVRFLSNVLFYLTRFSSVIIFLIAGYAGLVVAFYGTTKAGWVPMEVDQSGFFTIFYPFSRSAFLLGDYTSGFLVSNLLTIILYAVFAWVLSGVFNAFRQPTLFTPKGVSRLSAFYLVNLFLPVIAVLVFAVVGAGIRDALVISALHLVLGVFAYFMSVIFKQGLVLQEEQDLTL